jgi:hypothetical protein
MGIGMAPPESFAGCIVASTGGVVEGRRREGHGEGVEGRKTEEEGREGKVFPGLP